MQQVQKHKQHRRNRTEEEPASWPAIPAPRHVTETCPEDHIDEVLAENALL